jgi:uncharacterized membrane protein YhaH (DUF805 family)
VMTTEQAVRICFGKWRDYSGRATRSEFWQFYLFVLVLQLCLGWTDNWLYNSIGLQLALFSAVAVLITYPPLVSACVRRLHDVGLPGWTLLGWVVFVLLCLVGAQQSSLQSLDSLTIATAAGAILAVALIFPSRKQTNRYGPNPHEVQK